MDFAAIARRIEDRHVTASVWLATTAVPVAGGVMAYGGRGGYVNRACGLGLNGAVTMDDIDRVITFFTTNNEEAILELSPFADESLIRFAGERGFVVKSFMTVFVLPLATKSESEVVVTPPEGIVIERVDKSNHAAIREFVEISEGGFAPKGAKPAQAALDLTMKAVSVATNEPFVARSVERNGAIVGVGGTESSTGLSSFFGATVIPEWRGRGIHRALMTARVKRAIELKCDLACVMTSPGEPTERTAARLGFVMAYMRVILRRPLVAAKTTA